MDYFIIAWRHLLRNRLHAAINIFGLAAGIAAFIMIFIIIQYQTSFDAFHSKKERIYRMVTEHHAAGEAAFAYRKNVPYVMPGVLRSAFPAIEAVAPVFASHHDEVLVPDDSGVTVRHFKEEHGVFYTEPSFFRLFDLPLLAGSYESLKERNTVLLTKEIAGKYFGDWRLAIGKTIKFQSGGFMFDHGTDLLKVTGILAPIPANSDFQFKLVVSIGTSYIGTLMEQSKRWDETTPEFGCYVLLRADASAASPGDLSRQLETFAAGLRSPENKDRYIFQSLNEVHYDIQTGNYSNNTISHQLVNVLWLIAGFILAIACINFVNLATAQAINRSKEIGVRKVLGSSRFRLQVQFIAETFLLVSIALVFAAGISVLALPWVNRVLQMSVSFKALGAQSILILLLAILVVVTLAAGSYPAFVLSRFDAVAALKSKFTFRGVLLRRGLVVVQFAIAQVLIAGTLIVVEQMHYFMNQPLGFDKEAIVNVAFRTDSVRLSRMDYLKRTLLSMNGVKEVSFSSNTPVEDAGDMWTPFTFDHAAKEAGFQAITKFADDGYVSAYKLSLIAGRNLRPSNMTREWLINESMLRGLGFDKPEDILNKEIAIWDGMIRCPIVGVLKDFSDRSFRHERAPLLVTTNITMYNQAAIKLSTAHIFATMQAVQHVWEEAFPDFVFEYRFLDDKIAGFYKQEAQMAQLYTAFSIIAIFLSCLGLYGLASFMMLQHVKETGIRRLLGASAASIVYHFSKEYILLVAVAFIIAVPVVWYYMNEWLRGYVYRIDIRWWVFAASGLAALFIAFMTVSSQAVRAATVNPAESLRVE